MKLTWNNPEAGKRFAAALASGKDLSARDMAEILALEGLNVEANGGVITVHPAKAPPAGVVAVAKESK